MQSDTSLPLICELDEHAMKKQSNLYRDITLDDYEFLKKKINDDDLYNALFNRLAKQSDLDKVTDKKHRKRMQDQINLDDMIDEHLILLFEHDKHKHIISMLRQGGYLQSVFDGLMFQFGFEIGLNWYRKSKKEKTQIVIELINRFYGKDINYRRHIKPLTHRRVIDYDKKNMEKIHKVKSRKPKRPAKGHYIKAILLTYPPDTKTPSN